MLVNLSSLFLIRARVLVTRIGTYQIELGPWRHVSAAAGSLDAADGSSRILRGFLPNYRNPKSLKLKLTEG